MGLNLYLSNSSTTVVNSPWILEVSWLTFDWRSAMMNLWMIREIDISLNLFSNRTSALSCHLGKWWAKIMLSLCCWIELMVRGFGGGRWSRVWWGSVVGVADVGALRAVCDGRIGAKNQKCQKISLCVNRRPPNKVRQWRKRWEERYASFQQTLNNGSTSHTAARPTRLIVSGSPIKIVHQEMMSVSYAWNRSELEISRILQTTIPRQKKEHIPSLLLRFNCVTNRFGSRWQYDGVIFIL